MIGRGAGSNMPLGLSRGLGCCTGGERSRSSRAFRAAEGARPRGEPLEIAARDLPVAAADLSAWRDAFLVGGTASLRSRPQDDREAGIVQLQAKLGGHYGQRTALREERAAGERPHFGPAEVEAMSA